MVVRNLWIEAIIAGDFLGEKTVKYLVQDLHLILFVTICFFYTKYS